MTRNSKIQVNMHLDPYQAEKLDYLVKWAKDSGHIPTFSRQDTIKMLIEKKWAVEVARSEVS